MCYSYRAYGGSLSLFTIVTYGMYSYLVVSVNETGFCFVSFVGCLCHNGGVFRYLLPDTGVNITRNSIDNMARAKNCLPFSLTDPYRLIISSGASTSEWTP